MNTAQSFQVTHLPYGINLPERSFIIEVGSARGVRQKSRNNSKSIIAHVITLFKAPVV